MSKKNQIFVLQEKNSGSEENLVHVPLKVKSRMYNLYLDSMQKTKLEWLYLKMNNTKRFDMPNHVTIFTNILVSFLFCHSMYSFRFQVHYFYFPVSRLRINRSSHR